MALTANAIEHHASQPHTRPHVLAAEDERSCCAAHGRNIQDENDRTDERARERGCAGLLAGADTVEQAHHTFDDRDVRRACATLKNTVEGGFVEQPDVKIARRASGCLGMQCGVDVVRPDLEWGRAAALALPGREQPERHGRFADRAVRARDENSWRHQCRGCAYTQRRVRIVSLLPSATEIVSLLGLADQLVGVSADSDWPPEVVEQLPVLNTVSIATDQLTSREIDAAASDGHNGASLYHVDPDLLRRLKPELILTQEICEVCAVSRHDVELATRALGYSPRIMSLSPVTLEQVLEDVAAVARAAGISATALVSSLRGRVERVRARAADAPRPRVFCMEWLDPPYSAGHWIPELVAIAGGRDELGTPGGSSRRIDWAEVVAYAPEVLVLIPCSLSLQRVADEFAQVRAYPGWSELPAVRLGQVFAGSTQLFSRSGPRLVDGVQTLARMLHPERFPEPLPPDHALKVSSDGARLEPYR